MCSYPYGEGRGRFSAQKWGLALLVGLGMPLEEQYVTALLKFNCRIQFSRAVCMCVCARAPRFCISNKHQLIPVWLI